MPPSRSCRCTKTDVGLRPSASARSINCELWRDRAEALAKAGHPGTVACGASPLQNSVRSNKRIGEQEWPFFKREFSCSCAPVRFWRVRGVTLSATKRPAAVLNLRSERDADGEWVVHAEH